MHTITYETFYTSDKTLLVCLTHDKYPGHSRKALLKYPGFQYLPAIESLFKSRGFNLTIIEEL